jgi:hypothetical protein
MARYTCRFSIEPALEEMRLALREIMKSCHLETIYEIEDYVMWREIPGKVSFARLVTVEVLIDITFATAKSVGIKLVVKNEELPLKVSNHCHQVFTAIQQEVAKRHPDWQLLPDDDAAN